MPTHLVVRNPIDLKASTYKKDTHFEEKYPDYYIYLIFINHASIYSFISLNLIYLHIHIIAHRVLVSTHFS